MNPIDWYEEGHRLTMTGQYAQAVEAFDQAIALDDNFAEAYLGRAVCYHRLGDDDASQGDMQTAARLGCEEARIFLSDQKPARGARSSNKTLSKIRMPRIGGGNLLRLALPGAAAVAALAILVLAGATYWFGLQAEKQYHQSLDSASAFGLVRLVCEHYDRGFLSAKARTRLTFNPPNEAGKQTPVELALEHDITHGPLALTSGGSLFKPVRAVIDTRLSPEGIQPADFQNAIENLLTQGPIAAKVVIGLGGGGRSQFSLPAFNQANPAPEINSISWQGMTVDVTFKDGIDALKGSVQMPHLQIDSPKGALTLMDLSYDIDTHRGSQGLLLGSGNMRMGAFDLQVNSLQGEKQVGFNNLTMKTSMQLAGEVVNSDFTAKLDSLTVDGTQHGPARLAIDTRRLDAEALAQLQQMGRELQAQAQTANYSCTAGQAMMANGMTLLPQLLKHAPELALRELYLKTESGELQANAKVGLTGISGGAFNPMQLMSALSAQASASVSEGLLNDLMTAAINAKQLPLGPPPGAKGTQMEGMQTSMAAQMQMQLQSLVDHNYLVKDKDTYTFDASYQSGLFLLNGRNMDWQDFQQR